jgi:D-alanyl-D-alanine carboxypeptidase
VPLMPKTQPPLHKALKSLAFYVLAALACALAVGTGPLRAEALLVIDVESGRVIHGENATYPWYPASVTKLMTTYVTLKALRDGRITQDSLFTYSPNAAAQSPSKMGFKVGTQITVDNVLKMMLVHSANDMAMVLAEGVSGSIEAFADEMNAAAHRLGMTQTSYVNPNGLPADEQITSARDLAILARALIREFPEYDYYWHIASIRLGKRIYKNTNKLIDTYPGTDGMKTGFICASGFNLVATATRGDKRVIAVVLGAPSSSARAAKAAQLLERGFSTNPLSWLLPTQGTVDQMVPIAAAPPNLREDICGKNRRRPTAEDADEEASAGGASGDDPGGQHAFFLSSLQSAPPKGSSLLTSGLAAAIPPVDVYVGPARAPGTVVTNEPDPFPPAPPKKKGTVVAAKPPVKPVAAKSPAGKPAAKSTKPTADADPADAPATAAAPATTAAPATAALKPWPGETSAGLKPWPGAPPAASVPKARPSVAAVAIKPKASTSATPPAAVAPKTEAQ